MEKKNLFISNYSRIEKEVITLSQYVNFSDDQLNVYSSVICDLLLRCGAEIESLYKELYRREIDKELPDTVGEMAKKLDKIYCLKDKVLIMSNIGFNFDEFNIIRPFSYKPKSDDDFYSVFCGLKHDRGKNYAKATLRIMLLAVGGLYILNQIFLDKKIPIENKFFGEDIPELLSENTDIFAAQVYSYDWNMFDKRFERIRKEANLSNEQIEILKKKIIENTCLERIDYSKSDCLYDVNFVSGYEEKVKVLNATISDDEDTKKAIISSLFGEEKDIDILLSEKGFGVFDPIISFIATINQKNRMFIGINKKKVGSGRR